MNAELRMASPLWLQETQISRPQIALAPAAGLFDIERSHAHPQNLRLTEHTISILFRCRMSMTSAVLLSRSLALDQLCVMAHARTIKQKHSGSWTHAGPREVFQQSRRDHRKCQLSATKRGAETPVPGPDGSARIARERSRMNRICGENDPNGSMVGRPIVDDFKPEP